MERIKVEGKLAIGNISVMLVDDHAVVRMGFRLLLEGSSDIRVVAEADSGEDACRKFPEVKPDVVARNNRESPRRYQRARLRA